MASSSEVSDSMREFSSAISREPESSSADRLEFSARMSLICSSEDSSDLAWAAMTLWSSAMVAWSRWAAEEAAAAARASAWASASFLAASRLADLES